MNGSIDHAASTDERFIVWRINGDFATSDALPGVRIPNASFPGVVTTLPGEELLAEVRQTISEDGVLAARKHPLSDRPPKKRTIITKEDVQQIILEGKRELQISPDTILTDVAKELAASAGIQIIVR